ncbi:MAG: aspartate 1-decarboxylase [Microcystaceae cyanobacterium]
MNITTLYCKLHNVICTESRLDYMGSITIDQDWMEAARLYEEQAVDVLNISNGSRITTYAIAGKRGSGVICLNGAAAHHFEVGHQVIIIAYCTMTLAEKQTFQPRILLFSDHPPYQINPEQNKLQWLREIPQYSMLNYEL